MSTNMRQTGETTERLVEQSVSCRPGPLGWPGWSPVLLMTPRNTALCQRDAYQDYCSGAWFDPCSDETNR